MAKKEVPNVERLKVVDDLIHLMEDMDPNEVEKEFHGLLEQGYSPDAALAIFKSAHKFQIPSGNRFEGNARVIGKSGIREASWDRGGTRQTSDVADVAFLVFQDGRLSLKEATFWGDRVKNVASKFKINHCYHFKAYERGGKLTRVRDVSEISDSEVPHLATLEQYGARFLPLKDLHKFHGETTLVRGIIGRMIVDESGQSIGCEISDDLETVPVTVWFGGQYTVIPDDVQEVIDQLNIGREIAVYGYINAPEDEDPRINSRGVILLDVAEAT